MRSTLVAAAFGAAAALIVQRSRARRRDRHDDTDTSDGPSGPPGGVPFTVFFPDHDRLRSVDVEHPAALPRVGDAVEYIDPSAARHRFEVTKVVHTLQTSFAARPAVAERDFTPTAMAEAERGYLLPDPDTGLRVGLPQVFLGPATTD